MALCQDSSWTEGTEFLTVVHDTGKAGVSVAETSIGKSELCDGGKVRMFKHIGLPIVLGEHTYMRQI